MSANLEMAVATDERSRHWPQRMAAVFMLGGMLSCLFPVDRSIAEVKRIEIDKQDTMANPDDVDRKIGDYKIITGRAFGVLDPKNPLNAVITDIDLAPKNADGLVEYDTKFTLAFPADMSKSSGILWYDIVNRSTGEAKPNAYGHVSLVSGWQGDIAQEDEN
ncbi:MAG: hypothetical protein ACRECY_11195 [Phyllobacterium sp.]